VKRIRRATEKAFLFALQDGEEVWIPRSQTSDPDDYEEGDIDVTVAISEWIARQNNLL
jgi:hypothetical protein